MYAFVHVYNVMSKLGSCEWNSTTTVLGLSSEKFQKTYKSNFATFVIPRQCPSKLGLITSTRKRRMEQSIIAKINFTLWGWGVGGGGMLVKV